MDYKIKHITVQIIKYVSLIIGAMTAILPIVVVFFASFKSKAEYGSTGPFQMPKNWLNFDNYARAFTEGQMLTGFKNTVILLIISLAGAILIGTMTAYALHRFKFRGRTIIMGAFLIATLIPGVTTQVATFQIINALGLFNTRFAAIVLYTGTDIMAIYIFLQFLDSISVALDESAMLDGASYFTVYRKIVLPLLKPAISTVIILKGIGIYNDFYTAFLYMPKQELLTLSTGLFKFKGPYGSQWEVISAGIIIAIVPTLIAFVALQKYIYNGFTSGAVK